MDANGLVAAGGFGVASEAQISVKHSSHYFFSDLFRARLSHTTRLAMFLKLSRYLPFYLFTFDSDQFLDYSTSVAFDWAEYTHPSLESLLELCLALSRANLFDQKTENFARAAGLVDFAGNGLFSLS